MKSFFFLIFWTFYLDKYFSSVIQEKIVTGQQDDHELL